MKRPKAARLRADGTGNPFPALADTPERDDADTVRTISLY